MRSNSPMPQGAGRRSRYRGLLPAVVACVFALAVATGCTGGELLFSPLTPADAQAGSPYAATITVSQTRTPVGGASVSDGALPAGLDLELSDQHDNTIHISGTPAVAGTFHFTVSVWCYGTNVSGQTGSQQYTLVVK